MGKWLLETCITDSKINKIIIVVSSWSFILLTYIFCWLSQDNWLLSTTTRSSSSPYPTIERVAFNVRFYVPWFRYLPCVISWQKISWSSTTLRGKLRIWLKLSYGRLLSIVSNSLLNNSLLFYSLPTVCFENVIPTVIWLEFKERNVLRKRRGWTLKTSCMVTYLRMETVSIIMIYDFFELQLNWHPVALVQ